MSKIFSEFLNNNKGKNTRIILTTGYQLRGKLLDFDEKYVKFETGDYGNTNREILISTSAISTFIPG